jgi:DNA-directed RNA polymerase specialized sigma24 family protein
MDGRRAPATGRDFGTWLAEGEVALQRTAHLLTGSVFAGQDLVQHTLARLHRRWDRIAGAGTGTDLDSVALRTLVDEFRTGWRRPGRRGEVFVEILPDAPVPLPTTHDETRDTVWDCLRSLPARQRLVVVLRFHERLDEAAIADLTAGSVRAVRSDLGRALDTVPDPEHAADLVTAALRQVSRTTRYPATSTATVAARSRAHVRARRRAVIQGAAAAAAVVAVGWTFLLGRDHAPPPPARVEVSGTLGDLPLGGPPHVSFLEGDTFVTDQGVRVTARAFGSATTATPFGDGVLIAGRTTYQRPYAAISLVSGGSSRRLGCGTPSFAVGSGDPAYWLSDGCRFLGPGRLFHGTASTRTGKGVIYSPVGSTSSGVVAVGTVVLPQGAGSAGPVLIGVDGSFHRIPHITRVSSVSPSGATAVGLDARGDGVVADLATGAVRWRARETLGAFSPSGRYVVTMQNVGVQPGPGVGDVVGFRAAATGHRVRSVVLHDLSIVSRPVWESDGAVLVVAEDRRGQQAIVRVSVTGDVSRATPVAPSGRGSYRLASP